MWEGGVGGGKGMCMVTIGHIRVSLGYLWTTVGYLRATLGDHSNLGPLKVTSGSLNVN